MIFEIGGNRIKYQGNIKNNSFNGSGTLIAEGDGRIVLNGLWQQGIYF
jgi:hypothetical protein